MVQTISAKHLILSYIVMLLTFAICDGLWLGLIAGNWYFNGMSALLREQFITWPWLTFYLGYCGAMLYLAVLPAKANITQALLRGAIVGATAYGTYNLTNYSVIANWPITITFIDWAWGTCVSAIVSASGVLTLKLKH